jgi:hypothetical protein
LIYEECILKNKNKFCPYKKLSVFYNIYLKRTVYIQSGPKKMYTYFEV